MSIFKFDLLADYFQFYVQDERAHGIDGDSWAGDAVERMLAVAEGAIGVGTVRNVKVPVILEILGSEPPRDFESWDHITECSLETSSGKLVVAGCTDYFPDAARVEIQPGTYRARISGGGFESVAKHWEDGQDNYRVQLWPASTIEPRVLKQHSPQTS
jgi:hypothetical protein